MRSVYIILFLFLSVFCSFSTESIATSNDESYKKEKVTMTSERYYDQLYPGDAKEFRFYQGDQSITPDQFITFSQDEDLLKNKKVIRDIKIGGFSGAAILGGLTLAFFIPSMVFVAIQLNFYNQQVNYKAIGYNSWLEYYNAKYSEYFIPGLTCIVLMTASIFLLLIDLSVTFTLLYQHRFNERLYRQAVERYNEKLRAKYNITPEFDVNNDKINLGLKINL
jgi:hypothetical protein